MRLDYREYKPQIDETVFLAPNCTIIGRCYIGESSSIWFNTVIRADVNEIRIGRNTNIQDCTVIHCDSDYPTVIGDNVTVGHNAIIHGCKIGSNCIIGMGSTILDNADIGDNVIVGANSLITSGKKIPSGVLVMGSPARVVRELTVNELKKIEESYKDYMTKAKEYKKELFE